MADKRKGKRITLDEATYRTLAILAQKGQYIPLETTFGRDTIKEGVEQLIKDSLGAIGLHVEANEEKEF